MRNFGISKSPPEGERHGHLRDCPAGLGSSPVSMSRRAFSSSDMEFAAAAFVGGFLGLVVFAFCTIYLLLASQL